MPIGCARAAMIGARVRQLYTLGVEDVAWVEGYAQGDYTRTKEADHLYLFADGVTNESLALVAYVTDAAQTLTSYAKLKVDWEQFGDADNLARSHLVASTDKTGSTGTYDAELTRTNLFARCVDEVDISALNGNFYVRVHATAYANYQTKIRVYRVWLE